MPHDWIKFGEDLRVYFYKSVSKLSSFAKINRLFNFPLCSLLMKKQDSLLAYPLSTTNSTESVGNEVATFFQNHSN